MVKTLASLTLMFSLAAGPALAGGTINLGNGSDPESLDPHRITSVTGNRVVNDMCEGLVAFGPAGEVVPGLAEGWTVSEDGRTYTFTLRDGVKWSDGSPVTADDFVWSWQRSVTPATGPGFPELLYPVKNGKAITEGKVPATELGIAAPDDRTVVVTLERPFADFLAYSAASRHGMPVQRAAVERLGNDFVKAGNFHCTGAYTLVEAVPQSHIRLEKNPHYWDAANVALDTVIYHSTQDAATELKMFRAGELHTTNVVPTTQVEWARANLADSLRISDYAGTYYYMPNLTREPWKSNAKLRLALSLAVDRSVLVDKILKNGQKPAFGLIPPGLPGYENAQMEWAGWTQAEREAEARRLYAEAGYGPDNPLKLEILYNTLEGHKLIAIAVGAMWKNVLGVEATLNNQEWKVVLERQSKKSFPDLIRAGWIAVFPFSYLNLARTESSDSGFGYANPAFDALMAESDLIVDPVAYRAKLAEAEALLMADVPVIPLYHYTRVQLVSPKVKGWVDNLADSHRAKYLSLAE